MLSTDLSTVLLLLVASAALFVSGFTYFRMRASEKWLEQVARWIENDNADALSLRRIAEIESSFTDLRESFDQLLASHKRLRSRISMRELRERRKDGDQDDGPDQDELFEAPATRANGAGPEYKVALRNQLRKQGLLR